MGVLGVVVGVGLFIAVVLLSNPRNEISFGDDRLDLGAVDERIDDVPILLPDPVNGDHPIWVHHVGAKPEEGWVAFDAQVDGCPLEYDNDDKAFVDSCTKKRYPPDGKGLPQYEVDITRGRVIVDVRRQ